MTWQLFLCTQKKIVKVVQILLLSSLPVIGLAAGLGDFVRKNGQVKTGFDVDAGVSECKSRNGRLPTARELAKEATKYGATILEVPDYKAGKAQRDQFNLIDVIDEDGTRDKFYISEFCSAFLLIGLLTQAFKG